MHPKVGALGVKHRPVSEDILEEPPEVSCMAEPPSTSLTQPSQYLRSRCTLCFGGNFEKFPRSKDPYVKLMSILFEDSHDFLGM